MTQDDVLGKPAALTRAQQVAEAVLRVDQLGQHDVAEGEAEKAREAVVDFGHRERDQHLATICHGVAPNVCAVSTWRSLTPTMAPTVSENTNGTVAMKMNIIFWVSPIPNHKMVRGMSAAMGILRPNSASGAAAASTSATIPPAPRPGTPTRTASPNPPSTRCNVAATLCQQGTLAQQGGEAPQHFERAGQNRPAK